MKVNFFYTQINKKIGIYHLEDSILSIGKIIKVSKNYLFLKSYGTDNLEDGIKIFLIEKIKRVILEADYIEKLENVKKITQHFENLSEKINSFEDVCEEIIKRKYLILLNLKNGDIEKGYLVKKEINYCYFEIVNQELEVISKEIFDVNYIEKIRIFVNAIINEKNCSSLNKIELFSGEIFQGNLLDKREKIVVFKEIKEFSDDSYISIVRKQDIKEITEICGEEKIKYMNIVKYFQNISSINFLDILEICMRFKIFIFIDNIYFDETKVGIVEEIFDEYIYLKMIDENYHFIEKIKIKISEIDILRIKNYVLEI